MLWFLSMGNAGNLCRGSFIFLFSCRLYLLDFHTPMAPPPLPLPHGPLPHSHTGPSPTHTGQQEIGIQCFLDDFLKEMNPSQKMRTMNNGTPGGMCLTRAVSRKPTPAAERHVRNRRLWSQGWKEPWLAPLEWGENKWVFVVHTHNHLI